MAKFNIKDFNNPNAKHLMVDLETLGTSSTAPITSIGAVFFDPRNEGKHSKAAGFFETVNPQSCINIGADAAVDSFEFWMSQPREARAPYMKKGKPITEAVKNFKKWIKTHDVKEHDNDFWIWCTATFDSVILGNTIRLTKSSIPWKMRNVVDLRTHRLLALDLGMENTTVDTDGLIIHDPVDDCIRQIRLAQKITKFFDELKRK